MLIQYVGRKPVKTDNVAGTGLTWAPLQSHEVSDLAKCKKLLAHPDIWTINDSADSAAEAKALASQSAADIAAAQAAAAQTERDKVISDAKAAAEKAAADREASEAAAAAMPVPVPIEKMDRHALVRELNSRGIKFHPRSTDDTLRGKLQGA